MRNIKLLLMTVVVMATFSISMLAQDPIEPRSEASARAKEAFEAKAADKPGPTEIREGTKINGELLSQVDARTAKAGDRVTARVTKDVKQNGRTVIHKGDHLVGTVKEVHAGATANEGSRMAVDFDRLVRGESTTELHTILTSVVSGPSEQRAEEPLMSEPVMAPGPMRTTGGGRASGGGLVGGVAGSVTGNVNSTLDTATSATGLAGGVAGPVDAATQTTVRGNTTSGLATPLGEIRVGSMASAENQTSGSSFLSSRSGDLRLDSGTLLRFQVSGQARPSGQKNQ